MFGVDGIAYNNGDVDFTPVSRFETDFENTDELYSQIGSSITLDDLSDENGVKSRDVLNNKVRDRWQKLAEDQIVGKIINDSNIALDFSSKTGIDSSKITSASTLDSELSRVGLTMHETPNCKKIQFVPTFIHDQFKHSGGTAEMLERLIDGDTHARIEFANNSANESNPSSAIYNHSSKSSLETFQSVAEKIMPIIIGFDAIADPFNNWSAKTVEVPEYVPVNSGYVEVAGVMLDRNVTDILNDNGYLIDSPSGGLQTAADIINVVGSDDDPALTSPEEIKEKINNEVESSTLINNTPTISVPPHKTISAYSGSTIENSEYGSGHGKQIFLPNAHNLKESGHLKLVFESYEDDDGFVTVELPYDMTTPIFDSEDVPIVEEYKDDIDYLDKNTISTEGLNKVRDENGNRVEAKIADYNVPHGNQEDSNGLYYPDSWKPVNLRNGSIIFQISDGSFSKSSYFTDFETVQSCTKDGKLDMNKLLDMLQVADGYKKICITAYRCDF